jgi:hypothetical protein
MAEPANDLEYLLLFLFGRIIAPNIDRSGKDTTFSVDFVGRMTWNTVWPRTEVL